MTTMRIDRGAFRSSLAARASDILCLVFVLYASCKPAESGFSPTKAAETPNWQLQQQRQYQQYQQNGPPADHYPQQPQLRQARPGADYAAGRPANYPQSMGQPAQNYPHQPQNYPVQGTNYPMPTRNYPQQPMPMPMQQGPVGPGYRPVPVPMRTVGQPPMGPSMASSAAAAAAAASAVSGGQQAPRGGQAPSGPMMAAPAPQRLQAPPPPFLSRQSKASKSDQCGAITISEMHGYQVREYKVTTKDGYELTLHRLIHPADVRRLISENLGPDGRPPDEEELRRLEPKMGDKKPYLLLHGLVGSSASFVRNVDKFYQAPGQTYNVTPAMEAILRQKSDANEINWLSTADFMNGAFVGDISNTLDGSSFAQRITNSFNKRTFARTNLLDIAGDKLNFAYEFTQAFRKFNLPRESLDKGIFATNSLAFTLSNYGYDVWMVNLRGNEYSRGFNGPHDHRRAEYWDFNLNQLVKEDLLASVNQVKRTLGWTRADDDKRTMGVVAYSYGSLHMLALLSKFPAYQRTLQPIIMMAPTLLSSSGESAKRNFFIKQASKLLISHTGPFPNRADKSKLSLESIVCRLPLASKLCNLMTIILSGGSKSVKDIISDDRERALMLRDSECGQTSTGVLHQIVENLSQHALLPDYTPFVGARDKLRRGDLRRSVMIIRSAGDEIATQAEAERIKRAALQGMTLAEVVVDEPKFGHADFLFSKKNQFLVNAEVARMALVFDYVSRQDWANQKVDLARG